MNQNNETHWTALQAIAWVCLRDREYLRFIGEGSLLGEFTTPKGETRHTNVPGAPGPVHLEAMAAARGSPHGSVEDAEAVLIARLAAGDLRCWGRKSAQDDLREIPPVEWSQLGFREGRGGEIYAANGAPWTSLRFLREDLLSLWPDAESPLPSETPVDQPAETSPRAGRKTAVQTRQREIMIRIVEMLDAGEIPDEHGALAKAARQLKMEFPNYREDTIRRYISAERKNKREREKTPKTG